MHSIHISKRKIKSKRIVRETRALRWMCGGKGREETGYLALLGLNPFYTTILVPCIHQKLDKIKKGVFF